MDQLSLDLFSSAEAPEHSVHGRPGPVPGVPEATVLARSLESVLGGAAPGRVLLVGKTRGEGRELLRCLSLRGVSWLGVEPTTLRPLALEIAGPALAEEGLVTLDEFGEAALLDEALDRALEGRGGAEWALLSEGIGFREAVAGTVSALRLAGITSRRVRGATFRDPGKGALVAALLEEVEGLLRRDRRVDTAGVLYRATRILGSDPSQLPAQRVLLLPGLGVRGLAGRLVAALRTAGARTLDHAPVPGEDPPSGILWPGGGAHDSGGPAADRPPPASGPQVTLFRAAGIGEELREVLRRVMAAGARWDEVEIVTPDPVAYGSALHALSRQLEIPVTFAVGLPVERTRAGRVVAAWFRWIEAGFPSDLLRRLLEAGDLAPPGEGAPDPGRLARRLRRLRIGWGRQRYLPAVRRALAAAQGPPRPRREESEEEATIRLARAAEELRALEAFLVPVLEGAPEPAAEGDTGARLSPASVAGGLEAFLSWLPEGRGVDAVAARRLREVLGRIRQTRTRMGTPATALAVVRGHLAIRVPPPGASGPLPWNATAGALHLADLEHGGRTGRPFTFLVGLDADRVPGGGRPDPLLTDADRAALSPGDLPSTADRIRESWFRTRALLAGLGGNVTLSYSAWSAADGRIVPPSTLLLEAYRAREGVSSAGYEELLGALGPVRGVVPADPAERVDHRDVWMGALAAGGALREGVDAVRAAYPGLDAGLQARTELQEGEPGAHRGLLQPRPELDPRSDGSPVVVSASALEALGACGLRYLYRHVLGIRPPDDPEADPDRWLDHLRRGALLHQVFERSLREAREAGVEERSEGFRAVALRVLAEEAERELERTPAPGEAVRRKELEDLARDVTAFVTLARERGAPWVALELAFGQGGEPPVELDLPGGGRLRLRGAVDRVDRREEGLVVVDYKTGVYRGHAPRTDPFDGGRRLQHLVYGGAVERILGEAVVAAEYQYPTPRGTNEVASYPRIRLDGGMGLVDRLLDAVAAGRFLPTEDPADCAWCDYASLCRVRRGNVVESPPADWAASHWITHEAFRERRESRAWGKGGGG